MKWTQFFAVIAIAAVTSFVVGTQVVPSKNDVHKETAYERVMRTNTLRCGYIPYSYAFKIDPNTKQKSGVVYDVVEEIGRLNHIKIDWAEELTWATFVTALETGRVDAFCSGAWIETPNVKYIGYSTPLYFNGIGAYGRADETRYTSADQLNDPAVRLMARDGGTPQLIGRQEFPKATEVSLASGVMDGELIEGVLAGKADALIAGDDLLADYTAQNPGKMKELFPGHKIRTYPLALALPMQDVGLKNMIDSTLLEMKGESFVEKALKRNAPNGAWILDLALVKP